MVKSRVNNTSMISTVPSKHSSCRLTNTYTPLRSGSSLNFRRYHPLQTPADANRLTVRKPRERPRCGADKAALAIGDDDLAHAGAPHGGCLVVAGVSTGEQDRMQPVQFGAVELC